jgi:hypothetical protein
MKQPNWCSSGPPVNDERNGEKQRNVSEAGYKENVGRQHRASGSSALVRRDGLVAVEKRSGQDGRPDDEGKPNTENIEYRDRYPGELAASDRNARHGRHQGDDTKKEKRYRSITNLAP